MRNGSSKKAPVTAKKAELIRARVEAHTAANCGRSTAQRRLILDTLLRLNGYVTVPALLEVVHKVDPGVGQATVHRAMRFFVDSGVVDEHEFGDGFTHFELVNHDSHHDHLVCTACRRITEFEEPLIERLQSRLAERYDFTVVRHRHILYGLCARCQAPPKQARHGRGDR